MSHEIENPVNLYLIRHGETAWSRTGQLIAKTNRGRPPCD